MNEEDMCGRFIHVRAYIDDPKSEGETKVWKHNRFRWFDREVLEEEMEERTTKGMPWKVNQAGTSLCGMACIFYLFAKEKPNDYKKFAFELFRTGEATFNSYTSKPSKEVTEKQVNKNGFPLNTGGMPLVDYVTMAGTRNTDNPDYKGGNEQFQAINWPPLMTNLSEMLLGYKNVITKGIYNPVAPLIYTSFDIEEKIKNINNQFNSGYKLILMIDSDLIDDVWDFKSLDLHWVVLESEIKTINMLNEKGKNVEMLDFRVYSWGTNPNNDIPLVLDKKSGRMVENTEHRYLKNPISKTHFMNNFNGYIKVK
ncbi:hypothetical protein BWK63_12945 [Flavobacterium covae]|nr:hypothetical protein BWK63_12945 [Flavobacterium covae]POR20643.1 hypothetical protein BWK57_12855 [Flavobacterium columnare]